MPPSLPTKPTFLHLLAGWVGAFYLHLVAKTSFVQNEDHPAYAAIRRKKLPGIYTFWHNTQVFLSYAHKGQPINSIISQSKDGEYIAQVIRRLSLNAVRGSSSRGGEGAIREVCSRLERGEQAGFTPDGPRGPVQTVHGGVVLAARLTQAPIIPTAGTARRKITFRSWDKLFIPLPFFNRIVVTHGRPFRIPEGEAEADSKQRIREALNAAMEAAEEAERKAPDAGSALAGWLLLGLYTVLAPVAFVIGIPFLLAKYGVRRSFQHLRERLFPRVVGEPAGRRLWLHAASVGEWQALKPLLARLRVIPNVSFVITVTSPEARIIVAREEPQIPVRMLPLDLPGLVERWISMTRPEALIIVETELWPHLLQCVKRRYIPSFVVNGRLSERSFRSWRLVRPFTRLFLNQISYFFVRSELDGRHFHGLGAPLHRIEVTGNTKVDALSVLSPADRAERRRRLFGPLDGVIVIAGSTWPGEEQAVVALLDKIGAPRTRIVLAPRRPERVKDVVTLLESRPHSWSYWSKVKASGDWSTEILLVDTLGDLRDLYGACDVAFVGGSLYPQGGQNPLEPAAARLALVYGPSMQNFHKEALELKKAGAARQVRDGNDLLETLESLVGDSGLRHLMGDAAAHAITSKQGAAARTAAALKDLLEL